MVTISLLVGSVSVAYAKPGNSHSQKENQKNTEAQVTDKQDQQSKGDVKKTEKTEKKDKTDKKNNGKAYGKKQSFKINGSSVIKYGKYKLPIRPVTKGMGATLDFDKTTGVITVIKDAVTIVINLKEKTVTVNGVADTNSGIFTAKNDKKSTVLIKYIADKLGVRLTFSKDKITVENPVDTTPVTPVSGSAITGSAITVNN